MKLRKALLTGMTAMAVALPGVANAGVDFVFNWAATGEGGAVPVSGVVDELKFTAESVVVFNGQPFTAGTTFTDYVTLRVDQLFNNGNLALTPYGPTNSMEITAVAVLQGVQTSNIEYDITGGQLFLFYDGPNGGYTQAVFQDLSAFVDGALVEGSNQITGSGGNLTNAPDGALDLFVALIDLVAEGDFELLRVGEENVAGQHFLGITNSNNALCGGNQTCASTQAAILSFFEVELGQNQTAFHTRSDGSIEKLTAVPAPGTLLLLGVAMLGLGFGWRRSARV